MAKALYEEDFALWAEQMADLLEKRRFEELDIANLVEWDYEPEERSRSWMATIQRERKNIALYLEDSPSLKRYLTDQSLNKMYGVARDDAFGKTGLEFPETCPYSISEVLDRA